MSPFSVSETNAAALATTSVVVMVGAVCAVSGHENALLATESGSWRDQSKRCEKRAREGLLRRCERARCVGKVF